MSYILDALRKADAERESGAVPDLHAQQYLTMPADDEPRNRDGWLIALAGVLAAALLGVIGWVWLGRASPREPVTSAVAPAVVPSTAGATAVLPMNAPSAGPSTAPTPSAMAAPTAAPVPATQTTPAASPVPSTTTLPITVTAGPAPAAARSAAPARNAKVKPAAEATARADATVAASRVYQPAELPEAIRRELPPVSVNGSSYAADASSRVLIANGQVLHEGDTVAPGLQLEKIGRRSATLSFKGYRYELTY